MSFPMKCCPRKAKEPSDEGSMTSADEGGDENQQRGNWSGKFDFILSCIGYSVGLGNVWRFPYLCYRNGGGAFLIPYLIMLGICGLPLYYFELAFGQFGNLGPITIWRVCPLFKGIGYTMVTISALVAMYYNVVIAWAIYYFFASMQEKLPWSDCNNPWNDGKCANLLTGSFRDDTIHKVACRNTTFMACTNFTSPAEQYWDRVVLGVTDYNGNTREMEDIGVPQWHLTLCFLLAWIIVFLSLIKGVKSSGKVVYFTAIFPYVVLVALLINGAIKPGAGEGIKFYMTPDFKRLGDSKVWSDAATQIFYSLGVAFGGIIVLSSFNRFQNNCYRDALIVAIINCSTSIFGGFAIFSVIGYMAEKTGSSVATVVKDGPGLVFIAYPDAMADFPAPQLWAILFFGMVVTLGLDSQFAMMETVLSGLADEFPWLTSTTLRSIIYKSAVCGSFFLLGLPLVCQGGIYLFTLVDWYSASFSLFFVCFCELVAISYIYGIKNFCWDIKMMLGFRPGPYWIGAWVFTTPIAILFIFFYKTVDYTKAYYGDKIFPDWAEALGWLMVAASIIWIPIIMIYELCKRGCGRSVCCEAAQNLEEWGPPIEKYWHLDARYRRKLQLYGRQDLAPPAFKSAESSVAPEEVIVGFEKV